MAAAREPRRNAGNRMARMMEEEVDEDDFYKTTYGGFTEEAEDDDFDSAEEDSGDEVDSDFDRSEDDEPSSGDEEVDKPKRRKKGIITKAYKEMPSAKKATKKSGATKQVKPGTQEGQKEEKFTKTAAIGDQDAPMRKSSRKSTATNSMMTSLRRKEREASDKKKREAGKKPLVGIRRLTQEELLAEAEKTEKKNLKSLENYQRLEANRKKSTTKKKVFDVPTIKYLSASMPATNNGTNVDVEKVDSPLVNPDAKNKMSRNFIVFSHDSTFHDTFHWKRARPRPRPYCIVTNKPAKFIDPLTKIPYYDLNAFKKIREAYTLTLSELKERGTVR